MSALKARQEAILRRIAALEAKQAAEAVTTDSSPFGPWNYSEQTERVRAALEVARMPYRAVRVSGDYYSTPLEARAAAVGAGSTQQMLKMVLLLNSRDTAPPTHVAVITAYAGEGFDTKTVNVWYRGAYGRPKSKVNFRLDSEGEAATGFRRNGLSPFGSALACPTVVDSGIVARVPEGEESVVWLGGGEVDVKVGVKWKDLIAFLKPVLLQL